MRPAAATGADGIAARRPPRLGPTASLILTMFIGCAPPEPMYRVAGGDAEVGRRLVHAFGCVTCHRIPGQNVEAADVGPPLENFALRLYIAGSLVNQPENLVRWIVNPQEFEPGTAMPDLGVREAEARHIAAYLYTLRKRPRHDPADLDLMRRAWTVGPPRPGEP